MAAAETPDADSAFSMFNPFRHYVLYFVMPVCVSLLSYWVQFYLVYVPSLPPGSRDVVDTPDKYGMAYENVWLTTSDNVRLHAYLVSPPLGAAGVQLAVPPGRPITILYFHANAGNMGHRLPFLLGWFKHINCRILMISYRGYGYSEGSPSESGIKLDAKAALDYIKARQDTKNTKLVVYGQSMGGAVAIYTTSIFHMFDISALIVENTFLSIPDLVPTLLPLFRYFTIICHQKWVSRKSIAEVPASIPILFMSSEKDEMIPPAHMHELFQIAKDRGGVRILHSIPEGTHNDAPAQEGYFERIREFVRNEL